MSERTATCHFSFVVQTSGFINGDFCFTSALIRHVIRCPAFRYLLRILSKQRISLPAADRSNSHVVQLFIDNFEGEAITRVVHHPHTRFTQQQKQAKRPPKIAELIRHSTSLTRSRRLTTSACSSSSGSERPVLKRTHTHFRSLTLVPERTLRCLSLLACKWDAQESLQVVCRSLGFSFGSLVVGRPHTQRTTKTSRKTRGAPGRWLVLSFDLASNPTSPPPSQASSKRCSDPSRSSRFSCCSACSPL